MRLVSSPGRSRVARGGAVFGRNRVHSGSGALVRVRAARKSSAKASGSTSRYEGPRPWPKTSPLAIAASTTPRPEAGGERALGRAEADNERGDQALQAQHRPGRDRERPARRGGDGDHDRQRADEPEGEAHVAGRAERRRSGRRRRPAAIACRPRPKDVRLITCVTAAASTIPSAITNSERSWKVAPPSETMPSLPALRNGNGSGKT